MPAGTVLELVQLLNSRGIEVILDGGWAVDAQLGYQSRPHEDLDLAVFHEDVPAIRSLLESRGFNIVPRNDSWECNFVYGNEAGHLIDIHSCSFDEEHKNIFGVAYTWEAFQGQGRILNRPVRCVPPEILVDYHTGYTVDENDFHDVKLLCEKFEIDLPSEYLPFLANEGKNSP